MYFTLTDGTDEITLEADKPLPAGKHTVHIHFTSANTVTLHIDGTKVAERNIPARNAYLNSFGWDGISAGKHATVPVTRAYAAPFPFTGAEPCAVSHSTPHSSR